MSLPDAEWSEHDLKSFVRNIPRVSIGEAKAWVIAETHGAALNLTLKYMPPGEERQRNLGSSTFHPRIGGEGGYGTKAILASQAFGD